MTRYNRRTFLRGVGAASLASVLGLHIQAISAHAANLDELAASLSGRLVRAEDPDLPAAGTS